MYMISEMNSWYWVAIWRIFPGEDQFTLFPQSLVTYALPPSTGLKLHELSPFHVSMTIAIIIVKILFRQPC